MKKSTILWIAAIAITLSSVIYQRMTGPTYPIRGSVEIGGEKIKYKLLTTHETDKDARMEIKVPDAGVAGEIRWKRYKSYDDWQIEPLEREGDNLIVTVPAQPPAGKVEYEVTLRDDTGNLYELSDKPVIIRFKGAVSLYVLVPHIILMFAGMLWATRAGFEAVFRGEKIYSLTLWTTVLIFGGGLVFGPLVQKLAFNEWWTGWPFGHDLTDSKTAFVLIFWIAALWRSRLKGQGRFWIITAAVVTLAIYLIPHSVLGSEIDYTKIQRP